MTTTRKLVVIGLCVGAIAFTGCFGGSSVRVNAAKVKSAHKVALRGTKNVGVFQGDGAKMLVDPITAGLNAALPAEWKGVEVVPLAAVADASRPVGKYRVCANGVDPMLPEGFIGTPDKAYLGALATKLGVDAVLVASGDPMIRFFDGKGAKAYFPSVGAGFELTLVDRAGEELASIQLKNFETEYLPESAKDTVDAGKLGAAVAKLIAQGFVAVVNGGEFTPPSKPGLSGL